MDKTAARLRKDRLLPGTLDMLVLKVVLYHRWMTGRDIAETIRAWSNDRIRVPQGSWQPALERLTKERELLEAVDNGEGPTIYQARAGGRAALGEQIRIWKSFVAAADGILNR